MTSRQPIIGPSAWRGEDLAGRDDWITPLPDGAASEIDAALRGVAGLAWRDITCDDFPLPEFSKTLADLAHELEHGRGGALAGGTSFHGNRGVGLADRSLSGADPGDADATRNPVLRTAAREL